MHDCLNGSIDLLPTYEYIILKTLLIIGPVTDPKKRDERRTSIIIIKQGCPTANLIKAHCI
jgi:hypothetical protein